MKVGKLKKGKQFDIVNNKQLDIQTWGESNDYPQQVRMIVDASGTGKACVNVYSKFITGRGFVDTQFYKKVVNSRGQTNDYILTQISKDYADLGGFAIHVNYNANYKITEVQHIPIETVRFEKMDDSKNFDRVAIHPDWARQFTKLFKFKKEDIDFIHMFNPNPVVIQHQVDSAGGWSAYKGQVYFFSNNGEKTYPTPVYASRLTDMNTEEGIANVSNRNARNNFLASGMLIDYFNGDESENQENDTEKTMLEFQGDEEACKILYMQLESKDEKPEFVPFSGTNYDKEFTVTEKSVKDNIGRVFNQPPILRAEDVGSNFGADAIKNAYDYYNSVIENERMNIERVFDAIFKLWFENIQYDCSISPLAYNTNAILDSKAIDTVLSVVQNNALSSKNKTAIFKLLKLDDDIINELIDNNDNRI